jgi:hypothetical protein
MYAVIIQRMEQNIGEKCAMRSFLVCNPNKYYKGDKVKELDSGGECSTYR